MANRPQISRILLVLVALFALLGFIDSFLFHLKEIAAASAATDPFATCKISSFLDCGPVAHSIYAKFWDVPVSLLGLFFYEGMFLLAIGLWLGMPLRRWQANLITIGVLGGLLFAARLLYYSLFAIGSVCPYCLTSDVAVVGLAIAWLIWVYRFSPLVDKKT